MKKQRVPIEEFVMPYGKHNGKRLANLYYTDKQYLFWAKRSLKDKVGDRIREFLDKMQGYERQLEQPELNLGCNEVNDWDSYDRDLDRKNKLTPQFTVDDIPF